MNREIKFRAWDKIAKKMRHVSALRFHGDRTLMSVDYELKSQDSSGNRANYTLMQYVGVKDKYDKEIYEGDIIHNEWLAQDERGDIGSIYEVKFGAHSASGQDYYTNEAYGWYGESKEETHCLTTLPDKLIVIGNKYENPELLEKLK